MQGEKIVVVRCKGEAKMRMIESSSLQRGIPTHQVKYEPHDQKLTTPRFTLSNEWRCYFRPNLSHSLHPGVRCWQDRGRVGLCDSHGNRARSRHDLKPGRRQLAPVVANLKF
jgi:hypothetical protein